MLRIGIICPSEIAARRFLPAMVKVSNIQFAGVAIANFKEWKNATKKIISNEENKAANIIKDNGGVLYTCYQKLVESDDIDAVYIPLPPALHYEWARKSLLANKHVFLEKPATIDLENTLELIAIAKEKNLALHENYMFIFHNQLEEIDKIIKKKEIGDIRLIRLAFGFPKRAADDFRYNKQLGGGALFDCGGYTIKYADYFLNKKAKIISSVSFFLPDHEVDIFGSAMLADESGNVAQVSFGMDNDYRCEVDIWGSKGTLKSNRIFTAPPFFSPDLEIIKNNEKQILKLPEDNAFMKSIYYFQQCINDKTTRNESYENIVRQAKLIDQFQKGCK